jgi:beta-carotene hydroxylase
VWIIAEGLACATLFLSAVAVFRFTPIPLAYVTLVVLGSWTFPIVTAYLPHNAAGATALQQTRRFRGKIAAVLFREHLYHLEHHLYPAVPHQHWPELAKRLDPYFDRAGVRSIYLGF